MIGYACSNLTLQERDGTTPARTCRISTLLKQKNHVEYCVNISKLNLEDTLKILQWNKDHDIYMYRISASLFPFSTHPDYKWGLDNLEEEIEILGKYVKQNKMRVSSHLPQFINLGSPNPEIVEKSIADIKYHSEFFDRMELGGEHKIIIHMGGVYDDRKKTEKRFITVYNALSENIKKRLVLENDEKNWTVRQIVDIYKETGASALIDNLHWEINHETGAEWDEDLHLALSTWSERPKIHYAEQDPHKAKGAHSFYIKNIIVSPEFDTMVEAKGKEKAILPFITADYHLCKL